MTSHHKLMTDVALLLKTIQKIDNLEFPALTTYLLKYKQFSESLNYVIKLVLSEDMADSGRGIIEKIDWIKEETSFIYDELISIAAIARDETLIQVNILCTTINVRLFQNNFFTSDANIMFCRKCLRPGKRNRSILSHLLDTRRMG